MLSEAQGALCRILPETLLGLSGQGWGLGRSTTTCYLLTS